MIVSKVIYIFLLKIVFTHSSFAFTHTHTHTHTHMDNNLPVTYFTYSYGGNPFKVEISKNESNGLYTVKIYERDIVKCEQEKSFYCDYYKHVPIFEITNIDHFFVGKSPRTSQTLLTNKFGEAFDGNSLLLHVSNINNTDDDDNNNNNNNNNKNNSNSKNEHNRHQSKRFSFQQSYIFVGWSVFEFKTDNVIEAFISPIGQGFTSFPYAISKNKTIYFMVGCVLIQSPCNTLDPYSNCSHLNISDNKEYAKHVQWFIFIMNCVYPIESSFGPYQDFLFKPKKDRPIPIQDLESLPFVRTELVHYDPLR